ncbi:MAG: NAD(P)/FAD-dependent oxidoreductase [Patescibacteria group bacterium]
MENKVYDLIIIGAGPAGLSASIYASRYKLNHLVLGAEIGGQLNEIWKIENYPGFSSISGGELIQKFSEQARGLGAEIRPSSVSKVSSNGNLWEVETGTEVFQTKSIILAMGTVYRKMNIPGEKELTGKGVSYCATCDGMFFREKTVVVIGGGNSAVVSALQLAQFAKKIFIIYRGEALKAEPFWLDKISSEEKIEVITNTNVLEIKGENKVEELSLDKEFSGEKSLKTDGVFVEIGSEPGVELAEKIGVEVDEARFIKVKDDQSTSVPGVFAAGDITTGSNKFRQVLVSAAEGAVAVEGVFKYLKSRTN